MLAERGLVTFSRMGCTLNTDTAQATAEALLWLIPTPYLEFELARILGLDLSERGIAHYFSQLPVNTTLSAGVTFVGVEQTSIRLLTDGTTYKLTLAPPVEANKPVRFVFDADRPPTAAHAEQLRPAIKKLRQYFDSIHGRPGQWKLPPPSSSETPIATISPR